MPKCSKSLSLVAHIQLSPFSRSRWPPKPLDVHRGHVLWHAPGKLLDHTKRHRDIKPQSENPSKVGTTPGWTWLSKPSKGPASFLQNHTLSTQANGLETSISHHRSFSVSSETLRHGETLPRAHPKPVVTHSRWPLLTCAIWSEGGLAIRLCLPFSWPCCKRSQCGLDYKLQHRLWGERLGINKYILFFNSRCTAFPLFEAILAKRKICRISKTCVWAANCVSLGKLPSLSESISSNSKMRIWQN